MTQETQDQGVKIIRPYRRKPLFENSLEGSLYRNGLQSIPSAMKKFYPRVDARNQIRTGLDEKALKIQAIQNKKDRAAEEDRIKQLRLMYEAQLGEDLTPASPFWDTIKGNSDDPSQTGGYSLEDRDNIFDLNVPIQAVNYYWIMETGQIAKNVDDIESGKVDSSVIFYVHDDATESSAKFERKKKINNSRAILEKMSEVTRKKVAKIIGLPISETASAQKIYNLLDEYLDTPRHQLNQDPVEVFIRVAEMGNELLNIKALVIDLLRHNIVRQKGTLIREGETTWAKNVEEFEYFLADPKNSEALQGFMEKLESKLKQE